MSTDEQELTWKIDNVREAINLNWKTLATKSLTADQRKAIREHLNICNSTLKDLVERSRSDSASFLDRHFPNDSRTDANSSGLTTLLNPEFGLPNSYRALAGGTCGTRTIEHDGTGGAELPFILDKTEGHATLIRDCLLAQPHRIRRAGIRIRLGIGDCRQGCRDHHGDESNGAQFTHDVALQFGAWNDNDCSRSLFP